MLEILHIENVAVAKNIEINFQNGFNVLTGETGAGKSIIVDSINLLQGAKISKEIIRHGENRAVVSALFSSVNDDVYELCDEMGIEYDRDDMFSLSRTITVDGKNTVKINSRSATLTQLRAIGTKLINIHGQNENQSFLNKNSHVVMLDDFANFSAKFRARRYFICHLYEIGRGDIFMWHDGHADIAKARLRELLPTSEVIVPRLGNRYSLCVEEG